MYFGTWTHLTPMLSPQQMPASQGLGLALPQCFLLPCQQFPCWAGKQPIPSHCNAVTHFFHPTFQHTCTSLCRQYASHKWTKFPQVFLPLFLILLHLYLNLTLFILSKNNLVYIYKKHYFFGYLSSIRPTGVYYPAGPQYSSTTWEVQLLLIELPCNHFWNSAITHSTICNFCKSLAWLPNMPGNFSCHSSLYLMSCWCLEKLHRTEAKQCSRDRVGIY